MGHQDVLPLDITMNYALGMDIHLVKEIFDLSRGWAGRVELGKSKEDVMEMVMGNVWTHAQSI